VLTGYEYRQGSFLEKKDVGTHNGKNKLKNRDCIHKFIVIEDLFFFKGSGTPFRRVPPEKKALRLG
jgi:hypothetical protein